MIDGYDYFDEGSLSQWAADLGEMDASMLEQALMPITMDYGAESFASESNEFDDFDGFADPDILAPDILGPDIKKDDILLRTRHDIDDDTIILPENGGGGTISGSGDPLISDGVIVVGSLIESVDVDGPDPFSVSVDLSGYTGSYPTGSGSSSFGSGLSGGGDSSTAEEDEVVVTGTIISYDPVVVPLPEFVFDWVLSPMLEELDFSHIFDSQCLGQMNALENAIDQAAQEVAEQINELAENLEHGALLVYDPDTNSIRSLQIVTGTNQYVPVVDSQAGAAGLSASLESTLRDAGFGWGDVVALIHSHTPTTQPQLPGDPGFSQFISDYNLINSLPSANDSHPQLGLYGWITALNGANVQDYEFSDIFSWYIIDPNNVLREFEGDEFIHPGDIIDENRALIEEIAREGLDDASGHSC